MQKEATPFGVGFSVKLLLLGGGGGNQEGGHCGEWGGSGSILGSEGEATDMESPRENPPWSLNAHAPRVP